MRSGASPSRLFNASCVALMRSASLLSPAERPLAHLRGSAAWSGSLASSCHRRVMAAVSASSGASPGRTVSETQLRLFCNSFGHDAADPSVPGQRMDFSAESTPACATDDLPTPDAPLSIGQRPGLVASALTGAA